MDAQENNQFSEELQGKERFSFGSGAKNLNIAIIEGHRT